MPIRIFAENLQKNITRKMSLGHDHFNSTMCGCSVVVSRLAYQAGKWGSIPRSGWLPTDANYYGATHSEVVSGDISPPHTTVIDLGR